MREGILDSWCEMRKNDVIANETDPNDEGYGGCEDNHEYGAENILPASKSVRVAMNYGGVRVSSEERCKKKKS